MTVSEIQIGELTIVVTAKLHNPSICRPEFFKRKGVVEDDWETKGDIFVNDSFAQFAYSNDIQVNALQDRISFSCKLTNEETPADVLGGLVKRFCHALPEVNYMAIGVNPIAHVDFSDSNETNQYMLNMLTTGKTLKDNSDDPPIVSTTMKCTYKGVQIQLGVGAGKFGQKESKKDVVVFNGNLHHELKGEVGDERLASLDSVLSGLSSELDLFIEFVMKNTTSQENADD